jgi:hypothetical protein
MSADPVRASFRILTGTRKGHTVPVHFNPVSLQYQLQNTMQQKGGGAKQYVSQSTGKLTMDLQFDTTHAGSDVRKATIEVAKLMQPESRIPPTVAFEWGSYRFEGSVESYKETIDFFSPTGVPLRASVNVTLAATSETVFVGGSDDTFAAGQAKLASLDAVEVPAARGSSTGSPAAVASRGGDPGAARALGAANGAESLRFAAGASLSISAEISLAGPAAFASGGAGLGIGGGAGFGASAGASAGIGASASVRIGGGASAGVSASGGAFAGLGAKKKVSSTGALEVGRLVGGGAAASASVSTGSVAVGGRALAQGEASMGADVGGSLRGRLSWQGG